ncbi:MAG: exosortase/archaeosortase family protein [Planctomycetota bacterium]
MQSTQPGLGLAGQPSRQEYKPWDADGQTACLIIVGVVSLIVIGAYWNTLTHIAGAWQGAQYAHGWIIPLIAVFLLWMRRPANGNFFVQVPSWHRWLGAGMICFATVLRVVGALITTFTLENVSFIICLMGVFILVGGLPTFRWAGPAIAFLVFMLPLPDRIQDGLTSPLQRIATKASTYSLVTLGVDARQEGNKILLGFNDEPMNVADQCSGLRMLTIFSGLAVAMALISRDRPWWERVVIVMSAIPIAILVNVVRITLTGLLFSTGNDIALVKTIFHDAPGLVMMPLAIGLLYLEMQILSKLLIDAPTSEAPIAIS